MNKDKIVGMFNATNGQSFPLKMFGVIYQENGDFMIPRGGNFLQNGMVSDAHKMLTPYLETSFSERQGLEQPTPEQVPTPAGTVVKWFVDEEYKVIGFGFLLIGGSTPFPLYDSKQQALDYLATLTDNNDNSTTTVTPVPTGKLDLIVFQSCSDNDGVHFKIYPLRNRHNWSAYNYHFIDMGTEHDARIEVVGKNEVVIRNHDNKKNGSFKVVVSLGNQSSVYESYSSTCNHDGQPTDCPKHETNILINDGTFNIGDNITAVYQGENPCGGSISWYNKNTQELGLENNGLTASFKITGFPVILHGQPNCNKCHGWTEIVLY